MACSFSLTSTCALSANLSAHISNPQSFLNNMQSGYNNFGCQFFQGRITHWQNQLSGITHVPTIQQKQAKIHFAQCSFNQCCGSGSVYYGCLDDGNMASSYVNNQGGFGSVTPGTAAINYCSPCTVDNGTCYYTTPIRGCLDPNYSNYVDPSIYLPHTTFEDCAGNVKNSVAYQQAGSYGDTSCCDNSVVDEGILYNFRYRRNGPPYHTSQGVIPGSPGFLLPGALYWIGFDGYTNLPPIHSSNYPWGGTMVSPVGHKIGMKNLEILYNEVSSEVRASRRNIPILPPAQQPGIGTLIPPSVRTGLHWPMPPAHLYTMFQNGYSSGLKIRITVWNMYEEFLGSWDYYQIGVQSPCKYTSICFNMRQFELIQHVQGTDSIVEVPEHSYIKIESVRGGLYDTNNRSYFSNTKDLMGGLGGVYASNSITNITQYQLNQIQLGNYSTVGANLRMIDAQGNHISGTPKYWWFCVKHCKPAGIGLQHHNGCKQWTCSKPPLPPNYPYPLNKYVGLLSTTNCCYTYLATGTGYYYTAGMNVCCPTGGTPIGGDPMNSNLLLPTPESVEEILPDSPVSSLVKLTEEDILEQRQCKPPKEE